MQTHVGQEKYIESKLDQFNTLLWQAANEFGNKAIVKSKKNLLNKDLYKALKTNILLYKQKTTDMMVTLMFNKKQSKCKANIILPLCIKAHKNTIKKYQMGKGFTKLYILT